MTSMSKIRNFKLLLLFSGAFFLSCTVKESRTECPCHLEIGLDAFANVSPTATVEIGDASGTVLESRTMDFAAGKVFRADIPPRDYTLCIFVSGEKTDRDGQTLLVRPGDQADSIYAFWMQLDGRGNEQIRTEAVPHKQFACVTLLATHTVERTAGAVYTVRSDTGGLNLNPLRPSRQRDLSFRTDLSSGTAAFRLTRQDPESRLTLLMDDGIRPVAEFPLGEWIRDSGYDWTAEDLDDIVVDLDFSSGKVFIEIPGREATTQPVFDL